MSLPLKGCLGRQKRLQAIISPSLGGPQPKATGMLQGPHLKSGLGLPRKRLAQIKINRTVGLLDNQIRV